MTINNENIGDVIKSLNDNQLLDPEKNRLEIADSICDIICSLHPEQVDFDTINALGVLVRYYNLNKQLVEILTDGNHV